MKFQNRDLILIAGPCSAESYEQVWQTAEGLVKHIKPDIFRAGVWKARTRTNFFEGAGIPALTWLSEIQKHFQIPVATEVHDDKHVELCLKHQITVMWIGARTAVNSYTTQRIANALKNTDTTIMIKNPIAPDVDLWKSSIERFLNVDVKKIYAVHRGFFTLRHRLYRNEPIWGIPLELKRSYQNIPLICDPSHICGRSSCLLPIIQNALDLEYDGLMIETHYKPEIALSDNMQQITPEQLASMITQLSFRNNNTTENAMLEQLRKEIDFIDYQLIQLLAHRFEIVQNIGRLKKNLNLTILQNERFRHIFADRIKIGLEHGLQKIFLKQIIKAIHNEAIRLQMQIYLDENIDNNSDTLSRQAN